jgi:hypothetical protein
VGASRSAAVGVVTKGVDVEAALGIGIVAGNVPGDGGRGALALLLEDDGAGHLGVTSEDADCRVNRTISYEPIVFVGVIPGTTLRRTSRWLYVRFVCPSRCHG